MNSSLDQQIVVSGVGGQGVLFVTRLLAEAAVDSGLPVLTSETHGMAQRGGTVMSHIKVGRYSSPLIRPFKADGLLSLQSETLSHHTGYLKSNGWVVTNRKGDTVLDFVRSRFSLDAENLALGAGFPKSANLILLGFAVACLGDAVLPGRLFCSVEVIEAVLTRLATHRQRLDAFRKAVRLGYGFGKPEAF